MTALRNIWTDLVEKKLWPVALVLVLALIAVPVMLGSGGSSTPTPPAPVPGAQAAVADANAVGTSQQVSLDQTLENAPVKRAGRTRDPFKQLHAPKCSVAASNTGNAAPTTTTCATDSAADTTKTTTDAAKDTTGGTPATVGGNTTTTPTTTGTTTAPQVTPPAAKPDPRDVYKVSIRFGKSGHLKTRRNIERFTPLPSSEFPFFVYLGVLDDKQTAVFMISSDVTATGDGTCRPRKTDCQTIELKKGDTEFFDYSPTGEDADVTQFQLDILTVQEKYVPASENLAKARAAFHLQGARAVQAANAAKLIPQLGDYAYSRQDGLLHRKKVKKSKKASAARVPSAVSKTTPWGKIVKSRGAVIFVAKKRLKATGS